MTGHWKLVVVCLCVALVGSETLEEIVAKREGIVTSLRDKAESLHQTRCTRDCSCLGYDMCRGGLPTTCVTDFGMGYGCDCTGRPITLNTSAIYIPAEIKRTQQVVKEAACFTQGLDETFKTKFKAVPNTKWTYFGSPSGVFRKYPGNVWPHSGATCSAYDPRTRPWYIAASSGPKDVILIVDVSGSMAQNERLTIAKQAAVSVLNGLTNNDFVTVIKFSDAATAASSQLKQATNVTRAEMQKFVTDLSSGGGTNFEEAFKKAFDVIDASRTSEATSNCKTAILFLTDGNSPNGAAAISLINTRNTASIDARIFTYSLGSGATSSDPKSIACQNKGIHVAIGDGGDLRSKMQAYYEYFAAGIEGNQTVWTEEYTDASGLGQMVTAAVPAYDRTRSPPVLIGVAGTDVLMSQFTTGATEALRFLQQRSSVCPLLNLTACEIESLRSDSDKCGLSCPSSINLADNPCASGTISSKISSDTCNQSGSELGDPQCCCVPGWAWALIAIGGAAIIAGVAYFMWRRKKKMDKDVEATLNRMNVRPTSASKAGSAPMSGDAPPKY